MKMNYKSLNTINKHNIDCALLMVHLIMYSACVPPNEVPWFEIFVDRLKKEKDFN